jgi:hypothetical protein
MAKRIAPSALNVVRRKWTESGGVVRYFDTEKREVFAQSETALRPNV